MNDDDSAKTGESHEQSERSARVVDIAQHDERHLGDLAMQDYHDEVGRREREKRAQTQEVDASCRLAAAKYLDVPWESRGDGR